MKIKKNKVQDIFLFSCLILLPFIYLLMIYLSITNNINVEKNYQKAIVKNFNDNVNIKCFQFDKYKKKLLVAKKEIILNKSMNVVLSDSSFRINDLEFLYSNCQLESLPIITEQPSKLFSTDSALNIKY